MFMPMPLIPRGGGGGGGGSRGGAAYNNYYAMRRNTSTSTTTAIKKMTVMTYTSMMMILMMILMMMMPSLAAPAYANSLLLAPGLLLATLLPLPRPAAGVGSGGPPASAPGALSLQAQLWVEDSGDEAGIYPASPDVSFADRFGHSVAAYANLALVSAPDRIDLNSQGACDIII